MNSPSIFETLHSLLLNLMTLVGQLFSLALTWALLIVWTAWWLWGVNWNRLSDVLRRGAWAPAVFLLLMAALAWSQLNPSTCRCIGFPVGNFWWQLGAVFLLTLYTLFLGWLQGIFGWTPATIDLNPPAVGHDPHHSAHGHHEPEATIHEGHTVPGHNGHGGHGH